MVWPVSRPCRPRSLLHTYHHDGHIDVCGTKNDADDGHRSGPAAHDDADAHYVHGYVFHHSGLQRFDPLYRHAKYHGCDPTVAFESNFAPEGSSSPKGQKTSGTRGADEVSSAGRFGESAMPASFVRDGRLDREAAAAEIRRCLDTILRG